MLRRALPIVLLVVASTLHAAEAPVDPPVLGPPAPDAPAMGAGDEAENTDELADRRQRHDDLLEGHPQLDGGGIADEWRKLLATAEAAQKAVPTEETASHLLVAERYATLLDRELDLDQLLDRMEAEAAVLDAIAALKEQPELDADGAKAKRAAALRGEMLAALAKQHAVQREALAIRHRSARLEAEAEDKDAEAEKVGTAVEGLRSQLDALSGAGDEQTEQAAPAPAMPERDGF
jgi:hypothetical protein